MANNGYLHELHKNTEIHRLVATFPINKRPTNIYLPLNTNGSLNQLDSTEIEYNEVSDYEDFEVIITNLDNYQEGETIYESFEKEQYLLKYLSTVDDPVFLPNGSKIVVLDENGEGYKTFILNSKKEIKSAVGKVMSVQYEITPIYLLNTIDSLVSRAEDLLDELDQGAIVAEQTLDLEDGDKTIIEEQDLTVDEVVIVPTEGGLYYE